MTDREGITPQGLVAGEIVGRQRGSPPGTQEAGGDGVSGVGDEDVAGVEGVDG
jgi:hypothetical protein